MSFLEEFKVILLTKANKVLGMVNIATRGKDFVPADLKIIFAITFKDSASKIILVHNHSSSKLELSPQDKAITT